jgi:hypothetical protein
LAKKRARKRPNPAAFGFAVTQEIVKATEVEPDRPITPQDEAKDPAAVALGRKGGLKGGPARAKKLGKMKLSEAGRKAAQARWARVKGSSERIRAHRNSGKQPRLDRIEM